ncbi:hypothetical protein INS49_010029 [Diaporthe citri]|uniref:uncharacterized protein n=1 Tax=Diaporthe citri TaxID=83186 RepID=UPI001C802B57|nr:uncharacterized protein INS49_010029 [Diaporthe citri]KAG6361800.1 hypothetical protein INS49_010029 [Diaporthe citri]
MASNGKNSAIQDIRDHARHKHWKKFDSIIRTLTAMDASPTDLEARLRSVLNGTMDQGGKNGLIDPDSAVPEANADTTLKGKATSKEGGNERIIKVEDDEEQPRSATKYGEVHVRNSPATGTDRQKWKATEDIGTMDRKGKRLTRSKSGNQPASQQTGHVESKIPQLSFSEAPPDANKNPTPAAHIFRDERGVFVRPRVGWQFREIKGITKVWYDGKWRPLIEDQPSFKGVCEKGGWILPIMAGSKGASLEQRRRWERQGMVEFNSLS